MDRTVVGVRQGLYVNFPLPLVVGHVTPERLQDRAVEKLRLTIDMGMIRDLEGVRDAHELAEYLKTFRRKLRAVVRENLHRRAVAEQTIIHERPSHHRRVYFPQWHGLWQLFEAIEHHQKEALNF